MNLTQYKHWSQNFRLTVEQFNELLRTDLAQAEHIIKHNPLGNIDRHLNDNGIDITKVTQKIWDMAVIYQQMIEAIGIEGSVSNSEDVM